VTLVTLAEPSVKRTAPWAKPVSLRFWLAATVIPPLAVSKPVAVSVPPVVRLAPDALRAVAPPEIRLILPVVVLPILSVCPLVVPSVPSAGTYNAPPLLLAEILAVGIPLPLLVKANLALAVEVPPSRRSYWLSFGIIVLFARSHGLKPV